MQGNDPRSDAAVNLAFAMRQDGIKLWSYRCHREAEGYLAAYHVQERYGFSSKEELIRDAGSDTLMVHQEDELRRPCEVEATMLTELDVATSNTDNTSLYSDGDEEEHVSTINMVTKEEATLLRDETAKMWQQRSLVTVEHHYQQQLHSTTERHENFETSEDDNKHSSRTDKGLEETDGCHKQEEEVISDSEESFHSLEEFVPDELNELSVVIMESGSECYDDAETMLESTAVQTTAVEVYDTASQTTHTINHSVCVQTDTSDAPVAMTTSDVSTNTITITTDNATTNTITMVTVDNATNTNVVELVNMETNTVPKMTNDAIIQTEKLLVSRSQSEYESLIDKYKKYIEALKTEVTQEKSQRLVAEQMATIVQSEVDNLRQRNIDLTSQKIQLENELSETKVEIAWCH